MKPRVLFVSRERHELPLTAAQARKWDALSEVLDVRVLAASRKRQPAVDDRFVLVPTLRPRRLDGAAFYASLPWRVAREIRRFRPDAVIVQGVHEAVLVLLGRRLAGSSAKVVLEVHGDWRTATRLYGSPLRRLLSPVADALAPLAIRRVDAVRALSPTTRDLVRAQGREPVAVFPAYVDLHVFTAAPPAPLPAQPRALFVGVLERYKAFDTLAAAWRTASPRVPEATLQLVGTGTLSDLAGELARAERVEWTPRLTPAEIVAALDAATVLLLPSRSEGLPRVAIEALSRGRPVIGGRGGGTPDIVRDGVNGLLVDPEDPQSVADALVRVLTDRELAERLAAGARETAAEWQATPEEYAARVEALIRGSTPSSA